MDLGGGAGFMRKLGKSLCLPIPGVVTVMPEYVLFSISNNVGDKIFKIQLLHLLFHH